MSQNVVAAAVLYAKDPERVVAFYTGAVGLAVTSDEPDHAVLALSGFQLVVLRIPDHIAADIDIADPPVRREDTAVKLVFFVKDLAVVRASAPALGGSVNPPEREWNFDGATVCDGTDPEGNVIQLRVAG